MAIRSILEMGDPRLLRHAQPVTAFATAELYALVADLHDTMAAAGGAGIAAPQIGVDLQVVLFGTGQVLPRYPTAPPIPPTVLINPVITPLTTQEHEDWEGCLSVPGLRGAVPRWTKIAYAGFTVDGTPFERTVEDFHARVVQHECDHLWGRLFPSRIRDFTRFGFTRVLFPELATQARAGEDE